MRMQVNADAYACSHTNERTLDKDECYTDKWKQTGASHPGGHCPVTQPFAENKRNCGKNVIQR